MCFQSEPITPNLRETRKTMALHKFLNPKNDVAFRKIFGTEKNKDILLHFLNDMLVFREKKPITEVTFLKTIQDPEIAAKKTSIVDILCQDEAGNAYVVEMQVAKSKGFEKRAQYYAAKAYIAQMDKGDQRYYNLKEVIFLAIADFIMFPDKENYKSDHVILDKDTYQNDLKDFSFTFLELEKFTHDKDHLSSMIEKWAYYFKHAEETSEEDLQQIFEKDLIIRKAYEELDRFHWNEDELRDYESVVKRDRDNQAVLEEHIDQAIKKGIEQGMEIGEERGIEKGHREALVKVARNMLQQGLSIQNIVSATSLTTSEIQKIQLEDKS